MGFGKRRAAVGAVLSVCGMMALVSFASAQTRDRDLGYDVFRAFGAGSEIGVSVRELTNDEVSKVGRERAGEGVLVSGSGRKMDLAAAARRAAPWAVLDFRVVRDKKETRLRVTIRTAAGAKP